MPTEVYQFYVSPGSSNVSITAAMFGVAGVTLDTETKTQSVATDTYTYTYSITHDNYGD
tara:strand:+ start:3229 stop:3405 length:177 start_codon:yes stop_codon:yes gene_type:complete